MRTGSTAAAGATRGPNRTGSRDSAAPRSTSRREAAGRCVPVAWPSVASPCVTPTHVSSPHVAPRDVAVPDITARDVAVPDVAVPNVAVPNVAVADVAVPYADDDPPSRSMRTPGSRADAPSEAVMAALNFR